jgi:hypothetical protein
MGFVMAKTERELLEKISNQLDKIIWILTPEAEKEYLRQYEIYRQRVEEQEGKADNEL